VLRDVLLSQPPGLHKSEETVRVILASAAGDENVDLCDLAVGNLAYGRFVRSSLYYLGERGHTKEHFDSVKLAVLPDPEMEGGRDLALKRLETRIRSGR
jgi:hypothetical protein